MLGCENCKTSELGYCFDHIQKPKEEFIPPTYDELLDVVKKVLSHEGTKWLKVPCPHAVLGCNFCGEEYRNHDKDCLILKINSLLTRTA